MPLHPIEDCPHNETFLHIGKTLDRVDRHTERVAIAMEQMAQHSIIIDLHEKRLDKHDQDFRESFDRLRKVEKHTFKEEGAEIILTDRHMFWNGVKQQLAPYLLLIGVFLILVFDKFNLGGRAAKLWKEVMGG